MVSPLFIDLFTFAGPLRAQRMKERCLGAIGMRGIAVALVGQAMRRDAEEATAVSEVVLGDREIRELASL
eukprot:COSAG01_NODE_5321_length_4335_cov_3.928234_5_plen_70_part_00